VKHFYLIEVESETRKERLDAEVCRALYHSFGFGAKIFHATAAMRQVLVSQSPAGPIEKQMLSRSFASPEQSLLAATFEWKQIEGLFERNDRVKWDPKIDDGHAPDGYVPVWEREAWS
jgi:hypothetical protein